jgi:hypothetical protein
VCSTIRSVKTQQSRATYFIWIALNPSERPPAVLSYDLVVAKWDPVQPYHVRQAAAEYDQLGQDEFLARHGFGHAQAYLLILDDKSYDSKPFSASRTATRLDAHSVPTASAEVYTAPLAC